MPAGVPAPPYLAVLKSEVSTQETPFHCSVFAIKPGAPPKTTAAVYVPEPPKVYLAVLRSLTSVQADPFQDSVFATAVVV